MMCEKKERREPEKRACLVKKKFLTGRVRLVVRRVRQTMSQAMAQVMRTTP
jgi:hypothetical protein